MSVNFKMSKLDDVMLKHMHYVNSVERRPFSYKDFEGFIVDGHYYFVPHGTCRNKFSQFNKRESNRTRI